MIGLGFRLHRSPWVNVHSHDQRGVMNKASSALLATAGVTVGLLGFALPAGAATTPGGGSGTPPIITQPNKLPTTGGQGQGQSGGNNNGGDRSGGNNNGGDRGSYGKGGKGKHDPCPTRTKTPCP